MGEPWLANEFILDPDGAAKQATEMSQVVERDRIKRQ